MTINYLLKSNNKNWTIDKIQNEIIKILLPANPIQLEIRPDEIFFKLRCGEKTVDVLESLPIVSDLYIRTSTELSRYSEHQYLYSTEQRIWIHYKTTTYHVEDVNDDMKTEF